MTEAKRALFTLALVFLGVSDMGIDDLLTSVFVPTNATKFGAINCDPKCEMQDTSSENNNFVEIPH